MKVILQADVKGSGKAGDIVNVSDGYAKNSLLPKKLAVEATATNLNLLKAKKESAEHKKQVELENAQALADKLKDINITFNVKCGASGKLFGSITSKDIASALTTQHGLQIDKHQIATNHELKTSGTHTITIKLHPKVSVELKVDIIPTE
ncbi:MAG: 50S ribosomal protein L9 [Clostridiales bacterium]|jgi:large subunit ribosomal protein L9|nr:50S ribosomal protein L9 [Clostridiales bacterium]